MKGAAVALLICLCVGGASGAMAGVCSARDQAARIEPPAAASYLTEDGAIRIIGYNDMTTMVTRWNAAFAARHPGFRFSVDLPSTRSAPPALTAGRSALAPMGAPFTVEDLAAYKAARGQAPLMIEVAHASLSSKALSGPLAVMVARSSPLRSISVDQIRELYTRPDPPRLAELGGKGKYSDRLVHRVGLKPGTALALFLQSQMLDGADLPKDMVGFAHSADVVQRLKPDPLAIGFAAANTADASVRVLPIRTGPGGRGVGPSRATLRSGAYPLDRKLMIYVATPVEPWVAAYLNLVLSCEGQRIVRSAPLGYIGLSPSEVQRQRETIVKAQAAPDADDLGNHNKINGN